MPITSYGLPDLRCRDFRPDFPYPTSSKTWILLFTCNSDHFRVEFFYTRYENVYLWRTLCMRNDFFFFGYRIFIRSSWLFFFKVDLFHFFIYLFFFSSIRWKIVWPLSDWSYGGVCRWRGLVTEMKETCDFSVDFGDSGGQ